ncbi:hypothetical protein NXY11_03520 [Parabacteroides faecis]|uniref:hypothetical protein n=1 Tax=Parabacteroides TaxID=375288 RepID=UPI002164B224|nr:hypothetical protein [Parabacteroides faecis]MCS2894088.1 hypothetical protein [Parabacteroides faecis]UVQ47323.1 hypothetical protein NXY11_03520 [Parabacteroides faecis]
MSAASFGFFSVVFRRSSEAGVALIFSLLRFFWIKPKEMKARPVANRIKRTLKQ